MLDIYYMLCRNARDTYVGNDLDGVCVRAYIHGPLCKGMKIISKY